MSERVTCKSILLIPSEGRPLDDTEYPGFVHPTRAEAGELRIEIIGTAHRLSDNESGVDREVEGDRPYVEITLSTEAARRFAQALLHEAGPDVVSPTTSGPSVDAHDEPIVLVPPARAQQR